MDFLPAYVQLFLKQSRAPAQGLGSPRIIHQENTPKDMPTGQYDGRNSLSMVLSSCLPGSAKLTTKSNHHGATQLHRKILF